MGNQWTSEFDRRMRGFSSHHAGSGLGLSLKVRVTSGCFHREHSPEAFVFIDEEFSKIDWHRASAEVVEHESGPEILLWLAAGTAVATLAKSVVDLVVVILKARAQGIKKGDGPDAPLEVIVRRSVTSDRVDDEVVMRFGHLQRINKTQLEGLLRTTLARLVAPDEPPESDG